MKKRVISAIIMFMIVIPLLVIGGIPYSLGVGLLGWVAYRELVGLRNNKKNDFPNVVKVIGLLCVLFLIYSNFEQFGLLFGVSYKILCGVILSLGLPILFYNDKYRIEDAFHLLGTVLFLGIGFNLLIAVYNYGVKYFILLMLVTIMTDTFALFGGTLVGRNKFTSISPNKTIEGCVIGALVSTFVCTVYYVNVIGNNINILTVSLILLFLSVIGQCGDLFFSAIKREFNKKDFSNLIPGHGGVLDRLDSIIFVLFAFVLVISYL